MRMEAILGDATEEAKRCRKHDLHISEEGLDYVLCV